MKKTICPLLRKPCIEDKCAWFTKIQGNNPNTGLPIEECRCVVEFLPFLLIENSQQQRGTAAAVESFRNASVAQNDALTEILIHGINHSVTTQSIKAADINILPPEYK